MTSPWPRLPSKVGVFKGQMKCNPWVPTRSGLHDGAASCPRQTRLSRPSTEVYAVLPLPHAKAIKSATQEQLVSQRQRRTLAALAGCSASQNRPIFGRHCTVIVKLSRFQAARASYWGWGPGAGAGTPHARPPRLPPVRSAGEQAGAFCHATSSHLHLHPLNSTTTTTLHKHTCRINCCPAASTLALHIGDGPSRDEQHTNCSRHVGERTSPGRAQRLGRRRPTHTHRCPDEPRFDLFAEPCSPEPLVLGNHCVSRIHLRLERRGTPRTHEPRRRQEVCPPQPSPHFCHARSCHEPRAPALSRRSLHRPGSPRPRAARRAGPGPVRFLALAGVCPRAQRGL